MPVLDFKGKQFVYSHHLSVPFRELNIDAKKSLPGKGGPSLDDNLIIHGDNLHALKALLPKYAGKVDVIYIDPPYNTGNEGWAYNDNVNSPLMKEWFEKQVLADDLERHDKWLCMMWPRLVLLKELLADSGLIFVSIDRNELNNLCLIMNEIFGAENQRTIIANINNPKGRSDDKFFATSHEYIVVYDLGNSNIDGFEAGEHITKRYTKTGSSGGKYREMDLRKTGDGDRQIDRPRMYYPFYWNEKKNILSLKRLHKTNIEIFPMKSTDINGRWRWGSKKAERDMTSLFARYMPNKKQWSVFEKDYLETRSAVKPTTSWTGKQNNSERGSELLINLGFEKETFERPKPIGTIVDILTISTKKNSIILDSFAGSGTAAHAVQALNKEDGGNRKFILIETEDYADTITAERMRRVIKGVKGAKDKDLKKGLGGSFTYCELGDPIEMDSFFGKSKSMPAYEQLASYIAYTATGEALPKAPSKPRKDWFIGEVAGVRLHLIYKPDSKFMRDGKAALDAETAKLIKKSNSGGKPIYVFSGVKYMGQKELSRAYGITFCQLPYSIYRILGDAPGT